MAIEDITADAVHSALVEHDELGLVKFCARYGFGRLREYVIAVGDDRYGTRVVIAAAHGYLPGKLALSPVDVADDALVNGTLRGLGFSVKELRPPKWTREELVLACSQLFDNNRVAQRATDPAVRDLVEVLRQLPIHAPEDRGRNFRSVNSVQRKLYDLSTSLPDYLKKQTRGGSLDEVIVAEFLADETSMHREAAAIRATYVTVRAWALFSADGDRKYGGNTGYPDVLGSSYVYDNNVGNSKQLREGDLIVIRDDEHALGIARVSYVEQHPDVPKLQKVCPECGGARFDERKKQRPRFRCRNEHCHHEFAEPDDKPTTVTQFVAHYGGTWRALDGAISAEELKSACTDGAVQNAIRPLDVPKLEAMLSRVAVQLPSIQTEDVSIAKMGVSRHAAEGEEAASHEASGHAIARGVTRGDRSGDVGDAPTGGRRERKTKARVGQGPFRKELIKRYGHVCAITGPAPAEVLQAAHLREFAEHETHNLDEGALLRADVHLLFDNNLLAIDPATWTVVLAPSMSAYPDYHFLDGADFIKGPCPNAIADHFNEVTTTWA